MATYTTKGVITHISEIVSGTSKSGYEWQNCTLVLDVPGFQGAVTKQAFRVEGDRVDSVSDFNVGDKVEVTWVMYGREWNGKWFSNVDLVRIDRQPEETTAAKPAPRAKKATVFDQAESLDPQDHGDDLPF